VVGYRLLGPVEVWAGGQRIDAGPPRQRAVLAALLVDAGQVVPRDVIVDRVWGEHVPRDVGATLRAHVARIRRVLERAGSAAALVHRPGGYELGVVRDEVDLHRFRRLVDRARAGERELVLLREAVGLWRTQPLAGIAGDWAARMRAGWTRERLEAVVAWARAELGVDNPGAVLGPLTELCGEYPLNESLAAVLMLALRAAGRPAEALRQYETARRRLADDLGTDPGRALQAVYQAILRGDPAAPPAPAQLPPDVAGFAGRTAELARLDALLTRPPPALVIGVLSGTAGVGKTALGLHWAHRAAARFPDGQLYLNLRGFDPRAPAMPPAEAVRGLLDALGVPPERIPSGLEAQVGLYRSLVAGRRLLVLLDNARDAAQVRPLLPGSATALVLVTSRNDLAGLVAAEGARPLAVGVLPAPDAGQLLAGRLGPHRLAAEPDAVAELIRWCAGLPLALAVVAARAAVEPDASLAALAADLRGARRRLDPLSGEDPATDIRAVFDCSYRALEPPAARLFGLLGLHPGADLAEAAAASLAGQPPGEIRPVLDHLVRAHLVHRSGPARYALHDLLHAYAAERASDAGDVEAARERLLDHYLRAAHAADRLVIPARDPIPLDPAAPGVTLPRFAGRDDAVAWFAAQRPALTAAVRLAAEHGHDRHAWQIAGAALEYLDRWGHWADQAATHEVALAAAQRLGDPRALAFTCRGLGRAYGRLGRLDEARRQLLRAADLFAGLGSLPGEARTQLSLAGLAERQGRYRRALAHARRAYELFRAAGRDIGQGNALNSIGWYHALLGEYDRAVESCQDALVLLERAGDGYGLAGTWDSLGLAYRQLAAHDQSIACYRRAIDLHRGNDDRRSEARGLDGLAEAHRAAGHAVEATACRRQAQDIRAGLAGSG
jgi:DNA-binding SARP family transcriptional activator/tetratricopeptide (TPR) repeat protein